MLRLHRTLVPLLPLALLACESPAPTPTPDPVATVKPSAATVTPGKPGTRRPLAKPGAKLPIRTARNTPQAAPPAAATVPAPADVAKPPADALKTKSGLITKVLTKGSGKDKPAAHDAVKVHYSGWTKDGKMFDSSVTRGQPAQFKVGGVIKGWTEALQLMVVGEKRRLWIPAKLAYGEVARGGAPAGDLTFDVELLEVIAGPKPPPVPEDLAKPPADAIKTPSGLVYRYLRRGKGKVAATAEDYVTVNYSGWTKDGKMFDSSITRGRPATFNVGQLIKGWTEGLQLMKEGDTVRMWIPAALAYGANPKGGAPAGDLVFDVELINIRPPNAKRMAKPPR